MPDARQSGTRDRGDALIFELRTWAQNEARDAFTNERTRHTKRRHHLPTEVRPQEAHIDDLMNGCLYMNAAGYYHGPPGEKGDPLEASLTYGMGIYANRLLPIYCMFTVRESDIVDKTVVIARRIIDEFRHVDGWIGIVRYDCFVRLLNRKIDSRKRIMDRGVCDAAWTDKEETNMRPCSEICRYQQRVAESIPDQAPKRNISGVFPRYSATPKRANTQMAKGVN